MPNNLLLNLQFSSIEFLFHAVTFISDLIASNSDHRLIDDDIDKASDLFPLSE